MTLFLCAGGENFKEITYNRTQFKVNHIIFDYK